MEPINFPAFKPFSEIQQGIFLRRLNRFVVEVKKEGKTHQAHLPNPGRLWEHLLPGAPLLLTVSSNPQRTTKLTVVGVKKEKSSVLLHTTMANQVAYHLIQHGAIPPLKGYRVVQQEVSYPPHRFDLLLEKKGKPLILEVKACTLFHHGVALFPDAPSLRGKNHLIALSQLKEDRGILFVVHDGKARFFLPEYHTDPAFSESLYKLRKKLKMFAVAVSWDTSLTLYPPCRLIPFPWELYARERGDRGCYGLLFHLSNGLSLSIGKLGKRTFPSGYYVYVGSARKNLRARLQRHLRRNKQKHWHIDYLLPYGKNPKALPIVTPQDWECAFAENLHAIADWFIPSFGSSDCSCPSHLFGFSSSPLLNPQFIDLLLTFRVKGLERD